MLSKNYFRNTVRVSNSLDPDKDRHFLGPDLGPNYLQRLSAEGTRCHRLRYTDDEQKCVGHGALGFASLSYLSIISGTIN